MSVNEIAEIVPPPADPIDVARPQGLMPENELGIALPQDIYEFCSKYGSGRFGDTIHIFNPYSPKYLDEVKRVLDCYRPLRADEGDSLVPYEVFPASPGLFPCGDDVNGHMIFWLTEGQPDQWPIVHLAIDGEFEQWEMPLTDFLAKSFRLELDSAIWYEEWMRESLPHLKFEPGRI